MLDKLEKVVLRYTQVEQQLGDPSVYADLDKLTKLSREQKELQPIVTAYHDYRCAMQNYDEALAMMSDEELRDLAQEELQNAKAERERLSEELKRLLLPRDPNDDKNVILEIRSGVGGEEVGHAEHLCLDVRRTGGQAGQALHIVLVHADDIVETGEVGHGDGTRAVGQAVAAAGGMAYHARVGEFAPVVVNQAGAIYGKLGGEATARHEGAKHLFGGGRAADVAKAYK